MSVIYAFLFAYVKEKLYLCNEFIPRRWKILRPATSTKVAFLLEKRWKNNVLLFM